MIGANQRTVVSKMGYSCVQTSRYRGGNWKIGSILVDLI